MQHPPMSEFGSIHLLKVVDLAFSLQILELVLWNESRGGWRLAAKHIQFLMQKYMSDLDILSCLLDRDADNSSLGGNYDQRHLKLALRTIQSRETTVKLRWPHSYVWTISLSKLSDDAVIVYSPGKLKASRKGVYVMYAHKRDGEYPITPQFKPPHPLPPLFHSSLPSEFKLILEPGLQGFLKPSVS